MQKITEIRYGLSLPISQDVTNIFLSALRSQNNRELHISKIDPKILLGDPYLYMKKKLFILFGNHYLVFEESHNQLIRSCKTVIVLSSQSGKDILKLKYPRYKQPMTVPSSTPTNSTTTTLSMTSLTPVTELRTPTPVTELIVEQVREQTLATKPIVEHIPIVEPIQEQEQEQAQAKSSMVEATPESIEHQEPQPVAIVLLAPAPGVGEAKPIVEQESKPVVKPVKEQEHVNLKTSKKKRRIFIISNITRGGAGKYLEDITNHYKDSIFVYIRRKADLLQVPFKKDDIIFIQHLLFTKITVLDLIHIKIRYNPILVISIHDFSWYYEGSPKNCSIVSKDWVHNAYRDKLVIIDQNVHSLFAMAKVIICPSKSCLKLYGEKFNTRNFIHVDHNDIKIDPDTYDVPSITNKTINIGIMQILTPSKGETFVKYLKNRYTNYKDFKLIFLAINDPIPPYKVTEYFQVVKSYNMHSLLHLNAFPETYSYAISYSMNTGLPILYNNIGAFKERVPEKTQYFKVFESEEEMGNLGKLCTRFENMLDYIIENAGKKEKRSCEECSIVYREFYDNLFSTEDFLGNK